MKVGNNFTRPGRPVFSRTRVAVFSGGWAGVLSGWLLALAFAVMLLLFGCNAAKGVPIDRSDRPWLAKPAELASVPFPVAAFAMRPLGPFVPRLPLPLPPTKAVFGCYLEPSQVPGYLVLFEGQRDGSTNWVALTNFPYPMAGGYLYYTNALSNFTALLVRESFYLPRPAPAAYSQHVP